MDIVTSKIADIDYNQQSEVLRSFINNEGKESHLDSLMYLAADIIKSDSEISSIETQRVKDLLDKILNKDETKVALANLQEYLSKKDSTYELNWQDDLISRCESLKEAVPEEVLLHVLAFLYDLVKVDGVVDACEMIALKGIAKLMGVNLGDN